jgi:hypothetical protein
MHFSTLLTPQCVVATTTKSFQISPDPRLCFKMPDRRSTSRTNRLSAAFASTLSSFVQRVDTRTTYQPSRLSILEVPDARSSKESSRASSLHEQLDRAILAEAPTEPYLILENEYPSLRSLRTDRDIGDGVWLCCHCHHENILRHWKGPHPFKYLTCDRCNRKPCPNCHASEIMSPWPYGMITACPPAPGREVPYCHVCTDCGLSHRAEMVGTTLDFYGIVCVGCGLSSYGDWPRYHIGTVEPYRRDPDASFIKLIEARVDDAGKLAFHLEMAALEQRRSSRLSCRNPG